MPIPINADIDASDYDIIRSWIEKDIIPEIKNYTNGNLDDIDKIILYAQILAKNLDNVKTHQLRRFFSAMKNIQKKVERLSPDDLIFEKNREAYAAIQMLKPQFANAVGRIQGSDKSPTRKDKYGNPVRSPQKYAMMKLIEVVSPMISCSKKKKDFDAFINLFESIVAYHKAYAEQ